MWVWNSLYGLNCGIAEFLSLTNPIFIPEIFYERDKSITVSARRYDGSLNLSGGVVEVILWKSLVTWELRDRKI